MSTAVKKTAGEQQKKLLRIRITLTSRNVKALEGVCSKLVNGAKKRKLKVSGPVRMPTKTLRITTRKAPSGQGTCTYDRYEMRIHKRVIDMVSPSDVIRQITSVQIASDVDVEVTIANNNE